ncbi:hypothetical protein Tco_0060168 [Tanacetum coccineum]
MPATNIQRHGTRNSGLDYEGDDIKPQLEERFMLEIYQNANGATYIIMDVFSKVPKLSRIGHFKDKCPKAGNQQNDGARGRAYVVVENPQQNPNVVTVLMLSLEWIGWHTTELSSIIMRRLSVFLFECKILEVQGERPKKDLRSLACIKADEKKLDDIRVVRDFPEAHRQLFRSPLPVSPSKIVRIIVPVLKELQESGYIIDSHSSVEHPYSLSREEIWFDENVCVLFLQDRSSFGISPVESTRGRYTKDHSEEEHEVHLKTILDLLEKGEVIRQIFKCEFGLKDVKFLGHCGQLWTTKIFGSGSEASRYKASAKWKLIMDEAISSYSVHRVPDKMYYDLSRLYWWLGKDKNGLVTKLPLLGSSGLDTIWGSYGKSNASRRSLLYLFTVMVDSRQLMASAFQESVGYEIDMGSATTLRPTVRCILDEHRRLMKILQFVEEPIEIVERDVKKLKRRRIPLVKVRWNFSAWCEYTGK